MFPHPTSRKIARHQAFSRKLLLMRLTPAWELPRAGNYRATLSNPWAFGGGFSRFNRNSLRNPCEAGNSASLPPRFRHVDHPELRPLAAAVAVDRKRPVSITDFHAPGFASRAA